MTTIRTYQELVKLKTFKERYNYLKLGSKVGEETFGFDRYLNQKFYRSAEWKRIRDQVILRDNACDLGMADREINSRIIIHHISRPWYKPAPVPRLPAGFRRNTGSPRRPRYKAPPAAAPAAWASRQCPPAPHRRRTGRLRPG